MEHTKMKKLSILSTIMVLVFNCFYFSIPKAHAATGTLTALSDTMWHQQKNVNSAHVISFTPSIAIDQPGDTIVVTFPADFNFNSIAIAELTFAHTPSGPGTGEETLAASASATAWGAVFSGTQSRILTLTAPTDGIGDCALAAGYPVIIYYSTLDNATHSLNPSTAGSYTISIAVSGANTMTGKIGVVITDSEQIGVTATVDPTLTFAIAYPTLNFGSFVGTAIRYANTTTGAASEPATNSTAKFTAATNGLNGWSITIRDIGDGASNAGLYSSILTELIPADTAPNVTTASKKYGAYGKGATSGITINENFDNDATDSALAAAAQVFATTAGPSADKSIDLVLKAAIDATTKAGNYADTITVICTGNY